MAHEEQLQIARDALDDVGVRFPCGTALVPKVLVLLDAIRGLTDDLDNPTPNRLADIAYERAEAAYKASATYRSPPQSEPSHG